MTIEMKNANDATMHDCSDENADNNFDAAMEDIGSNSTTPSSTKDALDVAKLSKMLTEIKSSGGLIAGRDIMLLIGLTGAGKVRYRILQSTIYLCPSR